MQMSNNFCNFASENARCMTTQEVLNSISARVHQSEPTAKVLLFGSRARGDAHPDSDWDVMVLLNDASAGKKWDVSGDLFRLGWDLEKMISPIVYTQSEWEKKNFTPFYKNVMHDGIEL